VTRSDWNVKMCVSESLGVRRRLKNPISHMKEQTVIGFVLPVHQQIPETRPWRDVRFHFPRFKQNHTQKLQTNRRNAIQSQRISVWKDCHYFRKYKLCRRGKRRGKRLRREKRRGGRETEGTVWEEKGLKSRETRGVRVRSRRRGIRTTSANI